MEIWTRYCQEVMMKYINSLYTYEHVRKSEGILHVGNAQEERQKS